MKYTFTLFLLISSLLLYSQPYMVDESIVEVSGIVLTKNQQKRIQYIPFATVYVKNTNRGTYANYEGMFSIVVKKGETIHFSAVGFSEFQINIPSDYKGSSYSVVVELEAKDVNLNEVVIFPWPDRDNFRAEFLAMKPTESMMMEDLADRNLSRKKMYDIAQATGMDARENGMYYLQQQASSYSYLGQARPVQILNPLAWAQFFQQWQNKKKKKANE
jgi:hypothetical protein